MGQSLSTVGGEKYALGVAAGAAAIGAVSYAHCLTSRSQIKNTGLKEYSVVYTDRATNLMSSPFQQVMRDISSILKTVYNAEHTALIPGSGTYAMEACARAFGTGKNCMVLRNGYFSYRWSDIFNVCSIPASETVLKGRATDTGKNPHFAPVPVDEVVARIRSEKPDVVFAPHVETSTGIILSDEYIKKVSDAVHEHGGLFVLDCIASGTIWTDMKKTGVDVLISAPQKGWSGPACVGIVLLGANAEKKLQSDEASGGSFCCNLKKWRAVMDKYEGGAFMYYTTLPTDALTTFRNVMLETKEYGFAKVNANALVLGDKIRACLEKRGFKSVASNECKSPTVVVSYSDDAKMVANFKAEGIQIAGGVPFMIDEPKGLVTFRIGLFGLDKMKNVAKTVAIFEASLDAICNKSKL